VRSTLTGNSGNRVRNTGRILTDLSKNYDMDLHLLAASLDTFEKKKLLKILQSPSEVSEMTVREWLDHMNGKVPPRIKNSLLYSDIADRKMSEIRDVDLLKLRNFGSKSIRDFIEIYPALKTTHRYYL
jgi:hypothetical protein